MLQKKIPSTLAWTCGSALSCALLSAPAVYAQTQIERPHIADVAQDHGSLQSQEPVTINVHLKMPNQAAFDQAVEALYTEGSPTYHKWMSNEQIARFAPPEANIEAVKRELESHGMSVLSISADGLSIRARGAASNVEEAFHTQLHELELNGKVFHANMTPAHLEGAAGEMIVGVTGLTNLGMEPFIRYQLNPRTGKLISSGRKLTVNPKNDTGVFASIATNNCFSDPSTVTLTTEGASLPVGVYYGNNYDAALDSTPSLACAWTPAQMQAHYGLTAAYSQGLDGTGQTIVIVDGPTDGTELTSDLTAFASITGLPAITSSNFQILYPDGKPSTMALQDENWQGEASLDVEWAHSIAPKAKIIIEIMPTQDWDEFEYAIDYARQNKLANVISNSYGYPEGLYGAYTVQGFEQVLKKAAAAGVAVNFSSGDGGDEGTGVPNGGGESYPATSAYVTAIGGTSIGIPNGTTDGAEVGWGNNATVLSATTTAVFDPPLSFGFQGGSGGGVSMFIAKPSWQKSISGSWRQEPDISAVADPYTGAVYVEGGTAYAGIGGTSLACPVFSAMWVLANQKAGMSLGQAAPMIYKSLAGTSAVNDVVPVTSPTNIAGTIFDSAGATFYSSDTLLAPLETTTTYFSAFFNLGGEYVDLSFGTDTSLSVAKGWDNMTGWGVPNGLTFINVAAKAK